FRALPEPSDNSGLLSKNVTRIKERGAVKHDKARALPRPHVRCGAKQGLGVMRKAIYAVFASAMFAGSFFAALSLSAEVEARGSMPGEEADRAGAGPVARRRL